MQNRIASDNPRGLLDPGTYAVDVDGLRPRPVVELPKGFRFHTRPELARFTRFGIPDCTLSNLACRWTRDEGKPGGRLKVGFWNGEQIKVHPELCGRFEDFRRPGPSVDDLATTLAALPGFRAADPAPVSLGGYDGLYVELVTVAPHVARPSALTSNRPVGSAISLSTSANWAMSYHLPSYSPRMPIGRPGLLLGAEDGPSDLEVPSLLPEADLSALVDENVAGCDRGVGPGCRTRLGHVGDESSHELVGSSLLPSDCVVCGVEKQTTSWSEVTAELDDVTTDCCPVLYNIETGDIGGGSGLLSGSAGSGQGRTTLWSVEA